MGMDLIHLKHSFVSFLFLSFPKLQFCKSARNTEKPLILILLGVVEKNKADKEQNIFLNNYFRMEMFKICKRYHELSSLL